MKRLKNTKPKAKPNGWEEEFDKEFQDLNNLYPETGETLKSFISKAILSAEEVIVDKTFDWIWKGWGLDLGNLDRAKEHFKSLSLPDQERLSNTKTDE